MAEHNVGQGGVSVVPGSTQGIFPQWLGFYYATVASNADPLGLGRCQLNIPQVLGMAVSTWAWALTTPFINRGNGGPGHDGRHHGHAGGHATSVGTVVAVTFLGGDLSNPAYLLLTTSVTTVTTPVVPGGGTSGGTTTGGTTTGGTGAGGTAGGGTAGGTTGALTVTTSSLPGAVVNQAYSATLAATGGTGSGYAWSLSVGSLPSWATLNASTGVIAGNSGRDRDRELQCQGYRFRRQRRHPGTVPDGGSHGNRFDQPVLGRERFLDRRLQRRLHRLQPQQHVLGPGLAGRDRDFRADQLKQKARTTPPPTSPSVTATRTWP